MSCRREPLPQCSTHDTTAASRATLSLLSVPVMSDAITPTSNPIHVHDTQWEPITVSHVLTCLLLAIHVAV